MLKLIRMLVDWLLPVFFSFIRPLIKWFLRSFTRLSEIQRIVYGAPAGAVRTIRVENCLQQSRNQLIQETINEFNTIVENCSDEEFEQMPARMVSIVSRTKNIKPSSHPDFGHLLGRCVEQIWSYRRLVYTVDHLRAIPYDSNNLQHEEMLLELWNYLMPNEPLTGRISKQWQDIGFQGDDPKTDFRGMGILGLENLLYLAREYNNTARHILSHSMHPTSGYTFAIVGINLTYMAFNLLKDEEAKTHFYNNAESFKQPCSLEHFNKFYSYLFFEFDHYWIDSNPTNIMDFRSIFQSFEVIIMEALHDKNCLFKSNLIVEDI
ncbi:ELMO domain-containing protein 2 [Teleopsis dalmanni]|uniref:ELMO domain-containing protein 2 n=1 Tax=Teleopsis dalmanni TaxID=139649 RepID=UPI0018CDE1B2|nr:ELMO domain-containing protein 2 [Teleopsis dalmanni]